MLQKNKIAQKREKILIAILSGFCVFVFMNSTFHNIMLSYELGKDNTDTFIWLMIPESVAMLLMVFCSALIFKILFNLKHKRVMFLLLGAFFVLIGSVFKAGIRMKEEQDLTI